VLPGATYTLSAWVRGELNAQASGYAWALRLLAYNRQGAFISSYTVASGGGGSLTTAWQQRSGTVTLPGNATTVRVELFDYMTDGWVAVDDVSLTGPTVTKYYTLGSQRIAQRQGGALTYLHGDHLGSASLATDASGAKITDSDTRYSPYGVTRPGLAGTGLPTDRRFTGQREEVSLGLYDYGARQYAPALGRFLQADTLVPDPANPQSLNRYSYTLGNPLRYTDPSGHLTEEQINRWTGGMFDKLDKETREMLLALHFSDLLYLLSEGYGQFWGKAELGDSGLQFFNGKDVFSFNGFLEMRAAGAQFGLVRPTGMGNWEFAYLPQPWTSPDGRVFAPTGTCYQKTTFAQEMFLSKIPTEMKSGIAGALIGSALGPSGAGWGLIIGLTVGVAQSALFSDPLPGHQEGDEVLEYWYDDGLYEVTTIRGNRVLTTRWSQWWAFTTP